MMLFALGVIVGVALGVIVVGFLAIAAYQRGYDEAFGRRRAQGRLAHTLPSVDLGRGESRGPFVVCERTRLWCASVTTSTHRRVLPSSSGTEPDLVRRRSWSGGST